ncbi:hypothetical protein [Natronobacterium texcoconense]|uniref:Uncharacterized protein n=1 Tax=Natronobacterium texcoconense TaxID=1095778 RepID=A0A1H1BHN6_NATTX|nr:hypothetical protein [Natronobacterium texcoconense]SDQ51383.1 hypothetical protein SAMN04489842_1045 [Natronobacterium texcoconense]
MFAVVAGLVLIALGIGGVRYAPAIVDAQRRQGMTPLEDETIEYDDRIAVTKATGAVITLVGIGILAYGTMI